MPVVGSQGGLVAHAIVCGPAHLSDENPPKAVEARFIQKYQNHFGCQLSTFVWYRSWGQIIAIALYIRFKDSLSKYFTLPL